MEGFYDWVRNIAYYLIFISMLMNLLPTGKYEKYLKLFSGCILMLLVLHPITGGLRMEEQILRLFHTLSFESETGELKDQLKGMESKRFKEIAKKYETAVGDDIKKVAEKNGLEVQTVSVKLASDPSDPEFGTVQEVSISLKGEHEKEGKKDEKEGIEPIKIEVDIKSQGEQAAGEEGEDGQAIKSASAAGKAEKEEVVKLRKEVSGYYQVEERNVEIKLEDE